MKRHGLWLAAVLAIALTGIAADKLITDLTILTSPSTNSWIQVDDLAIPAPKSRKYLLTNLATVATLQSATNTIYSVAQAYAAGLTNGIIATATNSSKDYIDARGAGNMTNSGVSAIGDVAVATDTTGTQWTPTNSITVSQIVATNVTSSGWSASKAMVTDADTNAITSAVTATELGYVAGVTSALQTQIDGKQPTNSTLTALSTNTITGTGRIALESAVGTGNMVNTGASAVWMIPYYTDVSGTALSSTTNLPTLYVTNLFYGTGPYNVGTILAGKMPNTKAGWTNAMLLDGDVNKFINGAGNETDLTKQAVTNAIGVFDGDTTKFVSGNGTLQSAGNMTNTGASAVGEVPVYTDTSGTQLTPTNTITLAGLTVTGAGASDLTTGANADHVVVTNYLTLQNATASRLAAIASDGTVTNVASGTALYLGDGTTAASEATITNLLSRAISGAGAIISAGATELSAKAPTASPTFTGTATIPTAEIATATVGSSTFTNSPVLRLTTDWLTAGTVTNFVVDLSIPTLHTNIADAIYLVHTTNGTANFTANRTYSTTLYLINSSGADKTIGWPATWHALGSWGSEFTLTNGDWCSIAINFVGVSTDQTNNWIGVAYKYFAP